MDVFVIPLGEDRYELYCEVAGVPEAPERSGTGFLDGIWHRFTDMLRAAEERQRRPVATDGDKPFLMRVQHRVLGWVVERVAEQRLLWNLRKVDAVVVHHPQDLPFDQVRTIVMRTLRRDFERHRIWLVVHAVAFVVSGALAIVPGPNLIAYYFAFRLGGHWLSLQGARHGMSRVAWSGSPSEPLTELRGLGALERDARAALVRRVADRLQLQDLDAFFTRVAIRPA